MAYQIMPVYNIDYAVGQGATNDPEDVRLVQNMLTEIARATPDWRCPLTPLYVDGMYSENLTSWITSFQTRAAQKNPGAIVVDGRVDPMPMKGSSDWSASFSSGAWSTMYALNRALHDHAEGVHSALGPNLHLREGRGH